MGRLAAAFAGAVHTPTDSPKGALRDFEPLGRASLQIPVDGSTTLAQLKEKLAESLKRPDSGEVSPESIRLLHKGKPISDDASLQEALKSPERLKVLIINPAPEEAGAVDTPTATRTDPPVEARVVTPDHRREGQWDESFKVLSGETITISLNKDIALNELKKQLAAKILNQDGTRPSPEQIVIIAGGPVTTDEKLRQGLFDKDWGGHMKVVVRPPATTLADPSAGPRVVDTPTTTRTDASVEARSVDTALIGERHYMARLITGRQLDIVADKKLSLEEFKEKISAICSPPGGDKISHDRINILYSGGFILTDKELEDKVSAGLSGAGFNIIISNPKPPVA